MRVSVLDMRRQVVYYPDMSSIVGKRRGNQTYYYLVESARVAGKPRIVDQQYLGSAEEVMARLSGAPAGSPERTQHKRFGDLAAVWGILRRLGVADAIDEVCGPRRSDAAASVGTYLALATLNRVVAPRSKLAFADWWGGDRPPPVLGRHGSSGHRQAGRRGTGDQRRDGHRLRPGPVRAGAGHDELRDLHRQHERPGTDRPTRPRQAETQRPAPGRAGAGRDPRRRHPGHQPRLCGQPPRRHPVHRRPGRANLPLPQPVRLPRRRWDRSGTDGGLRRRPEQRRELRASHRVRAALRRVAATERLPRPARPSLPSPPTR